MYITYLKMLWNEKKIHTISNIMDDGERKKSPKIKGLVGDCGI